MSWFEVILWCKLPKATEKELLVGGSGSSSNNNTNA